MESLSCHNSSDALRSCFVFHGITDNQKSSGLFPISQVRSAEESVKSVSLSANRTLLFWITKGEEVGDLPNMGCEEKEVI